MIKSNQKPSIIAKNFVFSSPILFHSDDFLKNWSLSYRIFPIYPIFILTLQKKEREWTSNNVYSAKNLRNNIFLFSSVPIGTFWYFWIYLLLPSITARAAKLGSQIFCVVYTHFVRSEHSSWPIAFEMTLYYAQYKYAKLNEGLALKYI